MPQFTTPHLRQWGPNGLRDFSLCPRGQSELGVATRVICLVHYCFGKGKVVALASAQAALYSNFSYKKLKSLIIFT
ncbi:hypothetical protein XELAEV_18037195mg [Xenopus laevis]|uniref:Uncharacterized protein n=1 Tax=Xenopus laevis TaxID=8355 RepID=A0A974CBR1_XENLA|nr:hypothetical protein XELAEV_18037195mg [Xenopus laevis]